MRQLGRGGVGEIFGVEEGLLAVEVDSALEPAGGGFAAAKNGAVDGDDLAGGGGDFEDAAVAEGEQVVGQEGQGLGGDVAGIEQGRPGIGRIGEELEGGADAVLASFYFLSIDDWF